MSDEFRLLLDIAILLGVAKIFGEIAERLKIDSLVGEIIGGLLVGPILHWIAPTSYGFLNVIAMMGVLILLFLIGLSTRFDDVKSDIYKGTALASIAAGVSFIVGFAIGEIFFNSLPIGLFLGVALMGTSTAIPVKILIDNGEFKSKVGRMLVVIAMADDIITLLSLAALSTFFALGFVKIWEVVGLTFAVLGFILVVLTVGSKISDKILSWVQRMKDEQILLAVPLIIVFILAFVSQRIGIAAATGAFLAGMALNKSVFTEPIIAPKVKAIGYGFFIPLFFASSALIIDPGSFGEMWWFIVILVIFGVLAKALSTGFASGLFGFRGRDQKIIAIGMIPRGEYGIIISQIALTFGVITNQLYSAVIAFILITVIMTPILFKFVMQGWTGYKHR